MSDQVSIGVFLCSCTQQMKERLDLDALAEFASARESVVCVEKHPAWCLRPGLSSLKKIVEEHQVDRIVVGGCSYRTHKHIFAGALLEAGLNPYLFEIVNLKEQCAAVHPEGAAARARAQIEMAIVRTAALLPLTDITVPARPKALVVVGGLSGLCRFWGRDSGKRGIPGWIFQPQQNVADPSGWRRGDAGNNCRD